MGRRRAVLDPTNVQDGAIEVDLIPAKVDQFRRPQAVPKGDQDHAGIAVAPAVLAGRFDQFLDLSLGQVFAGPQLGIWASSRGDCPIYGGWGDDSEVRFHQRFCPGWWSTVRTMALFTDSVRGWIIGVSAGATPARPFWR